MQHIRKIKKNTNSSFNNMLDQQFYLYEIVKMFAHVFIGLFLAPDIFNVQRMEITCDA